MEVLYPLFFASSWEVNLTLPHHHVCVCMKKLVMPNLILTSIHTLVLIPVVVMTLVQEACKKFPSLATLGYVRAKSQALTSLELGRSQTLSSLVLGRSQALSYLRFERRKIMTKKMQTKPK